MNLRLICLTAMLPMLALLAMPAEAPAVPITCDILICQEGCFKGDYPPEALEDSRCDSPTATGMIKRTFASVEAPDPVYILCELDSGGHNCEVYPEGEGYTYEWHLTGWLTIPYPGHPSSNAQWIECSGSGQLTVTVHTPVGTSAQRTKFLGCVQ